MRARGPIVFALAVISSLSFAQSPSEASDSSSSKTQIAAVFNETAISNGAKVPGTSRVVPTLIEPVRPARAANCEDSAQKNACKFHWGAALQQSAQFLFLQHMMNVPTYHGTLKGPFFKDWLDSVKHYRFSRFQDDDPFIVNYIGHPMMGAVVSRIHIQNDPRGRTAHIGWNKRYWKSRAKALAFASVYAAQWEIGPFSETSIGNLGSFRYYSASAHHMTNGTGFTDMLVTPTAGITWSMGEDLIDKYVIKRIEGHSRNPFYQLGISVLNPTRSAANLLRWKMPWYRDDRNRGE
jgi:hypothetical protein